MSQRRDGNRLLRVGSISALALLGLVLLVSISGSVNASGPLVAPVIEANPTTIVSGESSNLTTTSSFSGGTSPYTCQWLRAAPGGRFYDLDGSFPCKTPSFPTVSTGDLNTTGIWSFLLQVRDNSSTPVRQTVNSASVNVTVNYLGATLTLLPSAVDTGQHPTVTANITWLGGISPYSVALHYGFSSTCSSDTNLVNQKNTTVRSAVINFTAPSSKQYYCATVTDSHVPPKKAETPAVQFIVNQGLQVSVNPSSPNIDNNQTADMTAVATYGTPPYHYQWYTGLCGPSQGALPGATSESYQTGALLESTTPYPYSVSVTDSSSATPVCKSINVTVNPALGASISPASSTIDSGQSVTLSVTPFEGTSLGGKYFYQWYTGSSCASTHSLSGQTSASYQATPKPTTTTTTTSYSVRVTDAVNAAPQEIVCSNFVVTVNPALSVPVLLLNPSAIDAGQTATVTANITWSGGMSAYSVTLYSGTSSTCSSDTTKVTVLSGSNPQKGVARASATFNFTAQVSTEYCASVTDGAPTPVTETSAAADFRVNGPVTASISTTPSSNIGIGSYVTLTVVPSGGTSSYHYQWYTGSSCSRTSALSGATSSSYGAMVYQLAPEYSVNVTDSSVGKPSTSFCANVTVEVSLGLTPTSVTVSCTNPITREPTASVVVGSATTCKATVSAFVSTLPTGTVKWSSNSSGTFSPTSCSLSKGACSAKFTPTAAGPVGLTAIYGGGSGNAASAGTLSLTVIRKTSTITVHCSPASVAAGSSKTIKCTAKVKGYSPTGNVTWSQTGGTGSVTFVSSTCTLTRGSCYVTLIGTSSGTVTIQATYDGDSNNKGSTGIGSLTILE